MLFLEAFRQILYAPKIASDIRPYAFDYHDEPVWNKLFLYRQISAE